VNRLCFDVCCHRAESDRGTLSVGDAVLYAVRASTGIRLWRLRFGRQYMPGNPQLANGVVYLTAGNVRGRQVKLQALSARTGKLLWSASHDFRDADDPTVASGMLYIGLTTGMDAYSLP
jgi:outer membrane protein assembly factor BamB